MTEETALTPNAAAEGAAPSSSPRSAAASGEAISAVPARASHAGRGGDTVAVVLTVAAPGEADGETRGVPNEASFLDAASPVREERAAVRILGGAPGVREAGEAQPRRRFAAAVRQLGAESLPWLLLPRLAVQLADERAVEATLDAARAAQARLVHAAAGRHLVVSG